MRYLLLIYGNPKSWQHPVFLRDPRFLALSAPERDALTRQWEALRQEITESGELVHGVALAGPATTSTVRVRQRVPLTTDGPYLESKEYLAGYLVVECESSQRAAEIAARIPNARFAAVEAHPIVDM